MIPVVKLAQAESVLEFPPALDAPWRPLQRYFGCTAESGNNTANVLHNFDITGERIFKINVGMNDEIINSEEAFFRMFYDVEYVVSNSSSQCNINHHPPTNLFCIGQTGFNC